MNKIYTLLAMLFFALSFAQPPAGYYSAATGTGYVLKTQLFNIITNHIDQGYAGLYTTYLNSDAKPNGKVWDMYSDCDDTFGTVANGGNQDNGTNATTECQLFNREHSVPQAYFGGNVAPMHNDAHFVIPTDKIVNGKRGDAPFGRVQNATFTSLNGSKVGSNMDSGYSAGYSSTVFEPIDEYKGDIARMCFYFVTCYESQISGFYSATSSTVKAMFDGTSDHSFSPTFLQILLTWNAQDPVSTKEIARNNAIYARQGNRNPYIDNNSYVTAVWGPVPLATDSFNALAAVSIFPNPATNHKINIQSSIILDEIDLMNINGQLMQVIKKPVFENNSYSLENLTQGFYFIKMTANNQSITKKVIVN